MPSGDLLSVERGLAQALRSLVGDDLPGPAESLLRWEMPKGIAFGDLTNAIAFKLAAKRRQSPHDIARDLAGRLPEAAAAVGIGRWIGRAEAKAGFVNVFLSSEALAQVVRQVLKQRVAFGTRRQDPAPAINIEFVSANPTGPLSVAHGRQAAVGDALARLLRTQGWRVTTEFYINDEGRQIELLGQSLKARYAEQLGVAAQVPEGGYQGAYLVASAQALRASHGESLLTEQSDQWFAEQAMQEQLAGIRADLERFGLRFDQWTSQHWLSESGKVAAALEMLRAKGTLFEAEGATWFASTKFGDDKDRVVRKRDGELTYLAPDIAYHNWKFERGYQELVNLWGPDHHGYIRRLKAAMTALGWSATRLRVRITQLVTLSRQGKPIPMSKRAGEFVTFREVLDEIGVDATRFFFVMRTMESHLDVDLELAKSQSQENPVYYVQYAYARICSILGKIALPWWRRLRPDLSRLSQPDELRLMRVLAQYPLMLQVCASAREPHGVTTYLRKLAEQFHIFYTKHRVIGDDAGLSAARRVLVRATQQVLSNGLGVLGVTAPTKM